MRKWMGFIRDHFDAWKQTLRVGDVPGVGAAEIYAHPDPRGDRSFVCLVNQNPFPRRAEFRLDDSIGLRRGTRLIVREIYPRECPIAEQTLPYATHGDTLRCILPPHSVRFLSVQPWRRGRAVSVYGHPAKVRSVSQDYVLTVCAHQGRTLQLGMVLPDGRQAVSVSARHLALVPMFRFEASAEIVAQEGNLCRIDVTMPRRETPRAITHWRVDPGKQEVVLPLQEQCGFLGALLHGAFSEALEVEIILKTRAGSAAEGVLPPQPLDEVYSACRLKPNKRQTFTTSFELPFIEGYGVDRSYGDDVVLELAFVDPNRVKTMTVRLNGTPVDVLTYRYPRNRSMFAHYIEMTGNAAPGIQELEVTIQWK